jgi:biopolymer transport protein ExbD
VSDATDSAPEGANQLPDPALFVSPDGPPQKKKRRALAEPGGLSITSLMDVLTIILVFLIKSYTTNPVQLKAAKDLKMPFSTAMEEPPITTSMMVTLNNLVVDDTPCLKLENGMVADADLTQGGLLIDRCFLELQETVSHQKRIASARKDGQGAFTETLIVMVDRHVPFKLITQVMYTAGQAQFSKFKFAVVKSSRK